MALSLLWLACTAVAAPPSFRGAAFLDAPWAQGARRRASAQSIVDKQRTVTWSTVPYLGTKALACTMNEDCPSNYKCEENPLAAGQKKCHTCMSSRSEDDCPDGYFCLTTALASDSGKDAALLTGQCVSSEWDSRKDICGNVGTCCCPENKDKACRKNDCDSQVLLPGPLFCDCHTEVAIETQCGSCIRECPAMTGHLKPLHWGDENKAVGMACMPGIAAAPLSAPPPPALRTAVWAVLAACACFFLHA